MIAQDAARAPASDNLPLVSVFMFVRNGAQSIRRAIDSVLSQTYSNIEFVVQDGASTDDTLEILRGYGDGLKIVSEPDNGPSDGLWRAINRCSGAFIGSCLADEELMPDAVERAVAIFTREPEVGAVTGDAVITDLNGRHTGIWTSGPFNLIDYLMADYSPYFCASFFRRATLIAAGLGTNGWNRECIEFELWCRMAIHGSIKYSAALIAKYAVHSGQSSNKPGDAIVHMRGRLNLITGLCSDSGFLGPSPLLCSLFIWGHARRFCEHAIHINRPETAEGIYVLVQQTLAGLPKAYLEGVPYDENYLMPRSTSDRWLFSKRATMYLAKPFVSLVRALAGKLRPKAAAHTKFCFPPPPDERLRGKMYAQLALRYEARHRLNDAVGVWKQAAVLNHLLTRAEVEGGERRPVGYADLAG